jgi:hypothetical protein
MEFALQLVGPAEGGLKAFAERIGHGGKLGKGGEDGKR